MPLFYFIENSFNFQNLFTYVYCVASIQICSNKKLQVSKPKDIKCHSQLRQFYSILFSAGT